MSQLYEKDFYGWCVNQAMFLEKGSLDKLDLRNLSEEIDSLGKKHRQELVNRLRVLFMHLLKWEYQPDLRGKSWLCTIKCQQREIPKLIKKNPSLKGNLEEDVQEAYEDARYSAALETSLPDNIFPVNMSFTLEGALEKDLSKD